jgi:hypothetical protein
MPFAKNEKVVLENGNIGKIALRTRNTIPSVVGICFAGLANMPILASRFSPLSWARNRNQVLQVASLLAAIVGRCSGSAGWHEEDFEHGGTVAGYGTDVYGVEDVIAESV